MHSIKFNEKVSASVFLFLIFYHIFLNYKSLAFNFLSFDKDRNTVTLKNKSEIRILYENRHFRSNNE